MSGGSSCKSVIEHREAYKSFRSSLFQKACGVWGKAPQLKAKPQTRAKRQINKRTISLCINQRGNLYISFATIAKFFCERKKFANPIKQTHLNRRVQSRRTNPRLSLSMGRDCTRAFSPVRCRRKCKHLSQIQLNQQTLHHESDFSGSMPEKSPWLRRSQSPTRTRLPKVRKNQAPFADQKPVTDSQCSFY